jgi:class 3 adenylate cyclase
VDWNSPAGVVTRPLTVLVVDLRSSSDFFLNSHAEDTIEFIREFSAYTDLVMRRVCNSPENERTIVKFTGDGFLLLFDEPDDAPAVADESAPEAEPSTRANVGPARAAAVAKSLADRIRQLCDGWTDSVTHQPTAQQVGLVSGIAYGMVHYGRVTDPAVRRNDAISETVIQAFRLAQQRNFPSQLARDAILVCTTSKDAVLTFMGSQQAAAFPTLRPIIDGIDFSSVTLGAPLRGVRDQTCYEATWPTATGGA